MSKTDKKKMEALAGRACEACGTVLYHLDYFQRGRKGTLRVFIDRPDGAVSHKDCICVSEQFGALLDLEDPISASYILEVSSPGMDRALYAPSHYSAACGRKIHIVAYAPVEGARKFVAVLMRVNGENIVVRRDNKEMEIPLSNIARAKVVLENTQGVKL